MVQLRLRKPRAILFDISGTVAKTSFIDKLLMPFIKSNIQIYLDEFYDTRQVRMCVENMKVCSDYDSILPKIDTTNKMTTVESGTLFVNFCLENRIENKAMTLLKFHMWFNAYDNDKLETPVYSDVAIQIQKWRCAQEIQLFVLSNGWSEATRRFLSKTNHGDLNLVIDDHFDSAVGPLNESDTFRRVLQKIGHSAEHVVYLTKSQEQGKAASELGITVVLVLTHRKNIEKLDREGKKMPRVRSFNELEFE